MARNLLLTLILGMFSVALVAQTSLGGKITEEDTGQPVLFGSVALYKDGVLITGTETDLDGNYNFANIDPGTYDVEASYVGFQTQRITDVVVFAGKANKLDIVMGVGVNLEEVIVTGYKVPLIEQDNTTQGRTITSDDIKNLPTRNISALAANAAGVSQADEGDNIFMKGSRSDATYYYVDGIRVQGNLVPETEIDQLQVITGGIEAQYGDVTGGIISITTKGPSSEFSGSVDAETSEYLDPYRNSLVGLSLSGPLAKNSKGESVLGFRLAGRYTYRYDDDPPAIPVYRVTDEKLRELEANPVLPLASGGKFIAAEEVVGPNDVQVLDANPFEDREITNITAKLDARLSKAIDVTLSGSYAQQIDRFTPQNWQVYNSHNNPYDTDTDYRANFRFRHRLGSQNTSGDSGEGKVSPIQNASYIIQVGFEKNFRDLSDFQHGDNLSNYGYIGNWDYEWVPQISFDNFGVPVGHTDFTRQFNGYTPGTVNPVLAAYNNASDLGDVNDIEVTNGQISTLYRRAFDFHQNVGYVYDLYRKQEDDIVTLNLTGNFDLVTGKGSNSGRHNIQFGIMYEQRTLRRYDVSPFDMWLLGDQLANRHIIGVDTNNVVDQFAFPQGFGDTVFVDIYDRLTDLASYENSRFFREVRRVTGQGLNDYVNVQGLSPEQMDLSLFSAQELNDQNNLVYYGYDYLGNKLDPSVTFDDFFTSRNADGIRDFPVAGIRPIYSSAYIQDKFTFKDIIFRLGLRVDRYDANTKVLKDPYSLYEIMGADDFHNEFGGERPGNIGNDYKVYVTSDNGEEIKAYRDGDQWYRANGTPVNDGNQIFESGGLVFPKIQNIEARTNTSYIKSEDFDQDAALEDYEVQVNWMPRLAFSFPISDEANFFAHYDILVQRPAANNIVTALDYFYWIENFENGRRGIPKNNANLLPERTVDYEVGFQQKLSNTSALKIAAYYKEMRNMVQRRTYLYVPNLITYDTYDNQDFGTVKGFTFTYDLRRTGNVSGQIAYTLQYADGTGSDPNSQRGLTQRGNLRTLFPLNFDERHRFNINFDYRYQSGKKYNGPVVLGSDILSNTGLNVQAIAVSGRPYTQKLVPARFGGDGTVGALNGARLPWNFTINARLDKSFTLGGKEGKRGLNCNVYIRVSNLLDVQNWRNVYQASGTPYDDGFLQSPRGQAEINNLVASNRNLDNYLASYQWRMLNANYFSLPRRIFIGAQFGF